MTNLINYATTQYCCITNPSPTTCKALVKRLQVREDTDRICNIIALLGQDFATSTNANHRKGGLIALAGVSVGLMGDTKVTE